MQRILAELKRPVQVGSQVYTNPVDAINALANAVGHTVTIKLPAHIASQQIQRDELVRWVIDPR